MLKLHPHPIACFGERFFFCFSALANACCNLVLAATTTLFQEVWRASAARRCFFNALFFFVSSALRASKRISPYQTFLISSF